MYIDKRCKENIRKILRDYNNKLSFLPAGCGSNDNKLSVKSKKTVADSHKCRRHPFGFTDKIGVVPNWDSPLINITLGRFSGLLIMVAHRFGGERKRADPEIGP